MSKLNFENIIKSKVKNFEYPLGKGAWNEFNKMKSGVDISKTVSVSKIISIITILAIPIIGIIYFSNNTDNNILKRVNKKTLAKKSIIKEDLKKIDEEAIEISKPIDNAKTKENKLKTDTNKKEREYIFCPNYKGKQIFFGPSETKSDNIKKFRMLIRDKKGHLIFESKNKNVLWGGKIKGKNIYAKEGYYNWFIVFVDSTNNIYKKSGKVKLVIN